MKDFLGQELELGDTVVTTAKNYRLLVKATIVAFTPKQVRLEYKNTWNGYSEKYNTEEFITTPSLVIKIPLTS